MCSWIHHCVCADLKTHDKIQMTLRANKEVHGNTNLMFIQPALQRNMQTLKTQIEIANSIQRRRVSIEPMGRAGVHPCTLC